MFDKFTDRARKSLSFSRKEAERFNHDFIGPEHMLLGLLKEGSGVGANVLLRRGLKLESIQAELELVIERGAVEKNDQQMPFTASAKRVLELMIDKSREMNHTYVGTEHLLIALTQVQDGPVAQIVTTFALTTEGIRDDVHKFLVSVASNRAEKKAKRHWLLNLLSGVLGKSEQSTQAEWTWARFDISPVNVFNIAHQEAVRRNHDRIGTEHILMGLAVASDVLEKLGLDPKQIQLKVAEHLVTGTAPTESEQLPFTPRAKKVLERAMVEADNAKSENVNCTHLLFALLQADVGVASFVLNEAGVTLEQARQKFTA